MGRYFGTDGIRGPAGTGFFTPDSLVRFGQAIGKWIRSQTTDQSSPIEVIMGRDTRVSADMIEAALCAGLCAQGVDVHRVAILPTPAISYLTRKNMANLGIMITASHNHHPDNGVKLFKMDGTKLSGKEESALEGFYDAQNGDPSSLSRFGQISDLESGRRDYRAALIASAPPGLNLNGKKIVLDCANGAASQLGEDIFRYWGAEVVNIGNTPNGTNININCGATATEHLQATVRAHKAFLGIALDGDGDRVICADERGDIIDGDQLLALLTHHAMARMARHPPIIVSTQMANLGFELWLKAQGLNLARTDVGDKYVAECMRANGALLGGEPSGHLILAEHAKTGDGLLAAIYILAALCDADAPPSQASRLFVPCPQNLVNIKFAGDNPLIKPHIAEPLAALQSRLKSDERLVVRKSGTEKRIRIMAQATTEAAVQRLVNKAQTILSAGLAGDSL